MRTHRSGGLGSLRIPRLFVGTEILFFSLADIFTKTTDLLNEVTVLNLLSITQAALVFDNFDHLDNLGVNFDSDYSLLDR